MKIPGQAGCGILANTSSFAPRLLVGGFKIKMEAKKTEELMFKAFKEGQKRFEAEDMPIKLWIAGVIEDERI
jgi:hypothetical protein